MNKEKMRTISTQFMNGETVPKLKPLAYDSSKRSGILKYRGVKWFYYALDGIVRDIEVMFN